MQCLRMQYDCGNLNRIEVILVDITRLDINVLPTYNLRMKTLNHETQIGILNKLLFAEKLRYKDLKFDENVENNTFQFHLNKVIEIGFIEKIGSYYSLTKEGKKFANHIVTEKNQLIKPRKISVHLYCIRGEEDAQECLIYTRKKHPFYGKQGFPAGKVDQGEIFSNAASRELLEETNLSGNPILFNIFHILVKDAKSKELLDDKLFLDFFILNPTGKLKGSNEGEYTWVPVVSLKEHIKNPFDDVEIYLKAIYRIKNYKGTISFDEKEHFTEDF